MIISFLKCVLSNGENICSVLDDFMVKLQLQVFGENASISFFFFKLILFLFLPHTSLRDLKGNRC